MYSVLGQPKEKEGVGRSSRVGRLCGGRILPLATISLFSVSASVFVLLVCLFCLF